MQGEIKVIKCVSWQVWNHWLLQSCGLGCVKHGWWDRFGHCPPPFLAGWSLVFAPPESIETYLHVGFARGPLLHMASWSLCTNSFSVRYWFCQDSDLSLILCIFSYICLHRSCRETTEIQDWMGATHIGVWSCLGRRKSKKIGALALTRSPAPSIFNIYQQHARWTPPIWWRGNSAGAARRTPPNWTRGSSAEWPSGQVFQGSGGKRLSSFSFAKRRARYKVFSSQRGLQHGGTSRAASRHAGVRDAQGELHPGAGGGGQVP